MAKILDLLDEQFDRIDSFLDRLEARDRFALIILAIFLIVTLLGGALWFSHKIALQQQQRLVSIKDTITWMQSNVVQLSDTAHEGGVSKEDIIRQLAQQQGLAVQTQKNQNQIKLITTHKNYAVLANFITQLTKQGITIVTMNMVKRPNNEIELNIVLS